MQQKHGNNSLTSFLLGVVVGALITMLFTTKKGRQILRTLSQEGLHKFSEVEDILGELEKDDLGDEEWIDGDEMAEETVENSVKEKTNGHAIKRLTSHGRKFFRKPARRN